MILLTLREDINLEEIKKYFTQFYFSGHAVDRVPTNPGVYAFSLKENWEKNLIPNLTENKDLSQKFLYIGHGEHLVYRAKVHFSFEGSFKGTNKGDLWAKLAAKIYDLNTEKRNEFFKNKKGSSEREKVTKWMIDNFLISFIETPHLKESERKKLEEMLITYIKPIFNKTYNKQ